ncbi:MAG: hypothetical protein ACU0DI_17215 [Paracoccaceae bacterium]
MRMLVFLLCPLLAAACDGPSPAFIGQPVREVTVDDSRFRVFMQSGSRRAEAHRISMEPLPSLVLTLEKGYRAIETATGCAVVPGSLRGDQAIILAEVDCSLL